MPVVAPVPTQMPLIRPVMLPSKEPEFDDVLDAVEDMPKELRERPIHDGFIRIDRGFLKHHGYASREQIERVEGDRVVLTVAADELLKH